MVQASARLRSTWNLVSSAHAVLPEARSCPASSSQTTHGVTQRERGRALRRGNAPPLSPSTATPTVSTPIPDAVHAHAHAHCPQDALDHCPGCGLLPRATLLTRGLPCPLHSASPPAWSKTALLAKAAGRAGRPASLRGCPTALATEARPCAFGVRHACDGDRDPVARGRQRTPPASPETGSRPAEGRPTPSRASCWSLSLLLPVLLPSLATEIPPP